MSQRPFFPRPAGGVPPRARELAPIFGVGRRMFVACDGRRPVVLTDEKGAVADLPARVSNGAEVELLAWQPRGAGGIRYRVRSTKDGVEGWLGAGSLRAPVPVAPAARRALPRDRPVVASRRARR